MGSRKTRWLLVGLVVLALWPAHASTQQGEWQTQMRAGGVAFQQGNYAEVERQWQAALMEAEQFGLEDPRLAASLNALAMVYQAQGRYGEAEFFYKRALAIQEKGLVDVHGSVRVEPGGS